MVGRPSRILRPVRQGVLQQLPNVIVSEPIVDVTSLLTRDHETRVTENPELMTHSGLTHLKGIDNLMDAHLIISKQTKNPQPGCVREALQQLNSGRHESILGQSLLQSRVTVTVSFHRGCGNGVVTMQSYRATSREAKQMIPAFDSGEPPRVGSHSNGP